MGLTESPDIGIEMVLSTLEIKIFRTAPRPAFPRTSFPAMAPKVPVANRGESESFAPH